MIDTLYIEKEIRKHPRAQFILKRFENAALIECDRYGEIFNLKGQNFRLQKQKPALILAKKYGSYLLKTPEKYGIGKKHNYYFSHMLNCIYDCRYCFLQGMYRSAHYVIFVNFEDFQKEIEDEINLLKDNSATFFSGYDGDSLALDQITNFTSEFISFFQKHPKHEIEFRTKSINIQPLLKLKPTPNSVIAYSLNCDFVSKNFENKTPSLIKRLQALAKLQKLGWKIGLRFDPLIYHDNWKENYADLFKSTFSLLNPKKIHSISLGAFRLPHPIYKNMSKLYKDEPLFFHKLSTYNEGISYSKEVEKQMRSFCEEELFKNISKEIYYPASF